MSDKKARGSTGISISPDTLGNAKRFAKRTQRTFSGLVQVALTEFMDRHLDEAPGFIERGEREDEEEAVDLKKMEVRLQSDEIEMLMGYCKKTGRALNLVVNQAVQEFARGMTIAAIAEEEERE